MTKAAIKKRMEPSPRYARLLDKPSVYNAIIELLVELVEEGYQPPLDREG